MKNRKLTLLAIAAISVLTLSVSGQDYEVDSGFNPQFDVEQINTFEFTTAGKILVGGRFVSVNGSASPKIIRLNGDGTTDESFISPLRSLGLQVDDEVLSIKTMADGKILIGGKFPSLGQNVRIARLNSDGTVDGTLSTKPTFDIFVSMVKAEPLSDGKFLACGPFSDANGTPKKAVARFNSDGSLDTTFATVLAAGDVNPRCTDLKVLPDGKILIVGFFYEVNGVQKVSGARLNADGTLDTSFTMTPFLLSTAYRDLMFDQNGDILVNWGGNFSDPSGMTRNRRDTGQLMGSFNCNNFPTLAIAVAQADGRTMISGGCQNPWNNAKFPFARFNADYSFDTTLDRVHFGADGSVTYMNRQADGKYVLIGQFTTVNGVPRRNIVRLRQRTVPTSRPDYDFDGDGKADLAIYRPSEGFWYIYLSAGGYIYMPFGLPTDKPVSADYDNDGKADIAVFRDGDWWMIRSADGSFERRTFGQAGDTPLVGHFSIDETVDDKVDMVLRSGFATSGSNVRWRFRHFGESGPDIAIMPSESIADKAVVADLDGDSIDEYGFFRDGYWKTLALGGTTGVFGTNQSIREFFWGSVGDIPVPADYDGDGQADYAVFRPSSGTWWVRGSSVGVYSVRWGLAGDVPVPADYDGDRKTDIAIFRNGVWWQLLSGTGEAKVDLWGTSGDIPIPAQLRSN